MDYYYNLSSSTRSMGLCYPAQISAAVLRACPDARKLESFEAPTGHYLRFAVPGKLGVDNLEFLIRNEGVGDRGWEGDAKSVNDWLVGCEVCIPS